MLHRPCPRLPSTQEEWSFLLSTNLESAFALCQLCHPLLKATGDAVVIFNSSVAGGPTALMSGTIYGLTKVGGRAGMGASRCMQAVCCPSDFGEHRRPSCTLQAALNQLAKNLTCEWAQQGIRAVAVAPW